MPRTKKNNGNKPKNSNRTSSAPQNRMVRRISAKLDAGATAWLRLLSDPCNAPVVPGCFDGVASGMLYRTRTLQSFGSSAVDGFVFFHPAGSIGAAYCPIQWASSNVTGTNAGTHYGRSIGGLPVGSQVRCVAACLKLRYSGSEQNRSGLIGHMLTSDIPFIDGSAAGVTAVCPSTDSLLAYAQTTYRLGETIHETRWIPSHEDGAFQPAENSNYGTGNAVGFVFQNVPAGAVSVEVTAVWEVVPDVNNNAIMPVMRAPTSSNTLNDVLRAIGDVARWATDTRNQAGVYNLISGVSAAGRMLSRSAPSVMGLLTM